MSYQLFYHPDVLTDISKIPRNIRNRIKKAAEQRLAVDPVRFGDPLRRSLQGYRKLRVGDYRVIYKIHQADVIILKIGHRKEVYGKAG